EEQVAQLVARAELGDSLRVSVVDETTIVPELNHCGWLRGWMKQQLIKLAFAHYVQTEFYITFDADVVLTRETTWDDFVQDGKAVYSEMHLTPHTAWYRGSARVLGVPVQKHQREHNVTPALLSRRGVLSLAEYLEQRAEVTSRSWAPLHLFPR